MALLRVWLTCLPGVPKGITRGSSLLRASYDLRPATRCFPAFGLPLLLLLLDIISYHGPAAIFHIQRNRFECTNFMLERGIEMHESVFSPG
jgi:hypothetical protein